MLAVALFSSISDSGGRDPLACSDWQMARLVQIAA